MENNMAEQKEEVFYGTVLIKAKEIMDFILESRVSPTLKEISENVDMTKSTVLKILKTLEHCGYVRRTEDAKQYYLGTMFLAYAQKVNHTFDIRQIAMPHLATLVSEIEETVNLGIVENQQITLLDKIESNSTVYLVARVGGQMHMYSSSMGKAILAEYSDDEISRYVSATSFEKLTPNTMTDISSLIEDVGKVKKEVMPLIMKRINQIFFVLAFHCARITIFMVPLVLVCQSIVQVKKRLLISLKRAKKYKPKY